MSVAHQSISSGPGIVAWKLRSDLDVQPQRGDTETVYTIKDPLRLTYFQTTDVEWMLLKLCDGTMRIDGLLEKLSTCYPDQSLTEDMLREVLLTAIHAGIMVPTTPGQGLRLAESRKQQQMSWLKKLAVPSFRWRGVDPTGFLRVIHPWLSWIYRPWALILFSIFVGSIAVLVLQRSDAVVQEMPDIKSLFTLQKMIVLTLCVAVVKAIHETGHALTCHHNGGECHELGLMMILFFPLLYCDVSDSWTMNDRWKRIAVSSAGILAELGIAAICGLLWMCSYPGTLHSFFLNMMILCSANTVLVNGNPLLRYDGYYVMSDLLQIPNLAMESRQAASSLTQRIVFGVGGIQTAYSPAANGLLAGWGMLSGIYRVGISLTLLTLMYEMLKPVGLEVLALIPAMTMLIGLGLAGVRYLGIGIRTAPRRARALAGVIGLVALLTVMMLTPVSLPVKAGCVLTPGNSEPVFVRVPGAIECRFQQGQLVKKDDLLAVLRNPELELQIVSLAGEVRLKEVQVAQLENNRARDPSLAAALSVAEQSLTSARSRLKTLNRMKDELEIRSPASGRIYLPRNKPPETDRPDAPQIWSEWAMTPSNQHAWLDSQTLLCWIGDSTDWRVSAYVDETDLDLVDVSSPATVRFLSMPSLPIEGHIEVLGSAPSEQVDRELIVNRMIAMSSTQPGQPQQTLFQATLKMNDQPEFGSTPLYATGIARIQSRPVSVAGRFWRLLCHTFSFRM
ncbi:MAG: hypothetical protein JNL58_10055 [Planctomyces sp.]|nr:hypothetical protein [Planctomyces sp.]